MKIGIIGAGYVGLVVGGCFADFGHEVTCMDVDSKKIDSLKNGKTPIYEPGLSELLKKNYAARRIDFTTNIEKTVCENDLIFIAVGTPPKEDGSADLSCVFSVVESIGKYMNRSKIVVEKSTVPVGTGRLIKNKLANQLKKRGVDFDFDVVSNPEFLREGKSIQDFMRPDRIVVGCEGEKAAKIMKRLYEVFCLNDVPFITTDIETAETIKYASNAFLAVKISFVNEMALLAEKIGVNILDIAQAMGMDGRISPKFLRAGCGFGGSCFPKDARAIVEIAKNHGLDFLIVKAAIEANKIQKEKMVEKISSAMGNLIGRIITILGLSFKPETDDMREAPSLDIIPLLIEKGAKIQAYCPQGMRESKRRLAKYAGEIGYFDDAYSAAAGSSAIVILTEWSQFSSLDFKRLLSKMEENYFFDLRNVYASDDSIRDFFKYFGVGVV